MNYGRPDYFAMGDWNALCWECGRKRKASSLKKHWQGYYVCPEHWEPRQPQDFVRSVADIITPPWVQPPPCEEAEAEVYAPFTGAAAEDALFVIRNAKRMAAIKNAQLGVFPPLITPGYSSSIYFHTGVSYASAPVSNDWNTGTGNFTFEADIRLEADTISGTHRIFGHWQIAVATSFIFQLNRTTLVFASEGIPTGILGGTISTSLNTWYHVAACRFGDRLDLYFGPSGGACVSVANVTGAAGWANTSVTADLGIGCRTAASADPDFTFRGWMDNARIVTGHAVYRGDFNISNPSDSNIVQPSAAQTKLLLYGGGSDGSTTITDSSTSARTITGVFAEIDTAQYATPYY